MRRNEKMTYRIFKLGIWERVEGIGPNNWLFFKILRMHSWKISRHNLIIGLAKQNFSRREILPKSSQIFQLFHLWNWKWYISQNQMKKKGKGTGMGTLMPTWSKCSVKSWSIRLSNILSNIYTTDTNANTGSNP